MRSVLTDRGFTLADTMVTVALIGVVCAIAIPSITGSVERLRLTQVTREVERELQMAKQRAVGKGRPMRIRFNCPVAGQYRIVELIGSTSAPAGQDNAADRCSETQFPFPAGDNNPLTRPNLDGPIRRLESQTTFGAAQTIEFWPDGTAHYDNGGVNPWPMIPTAGIQVTLGRMGKTSIVSVNGLGKIDIVQQQ